ncbi:kinase-like domain-containing protein [Mycena filopes]|nr:kinase-like domain-containing protein [Mycena filopes]
MTLCMYDVFLTLITLTSWSLTFRILYPMLWEQPCDARNLAAHCSKYVLQEKELTNMELETAGNAFVVSSADYRGHRVVVKRWHGAVVPHESRVLFAKRLIRDLDRWSALDHPNIAPVLGVALHVANLPALVVPRLRTVHQVLQANPNTDVVELMRGVAAGLSYLHAQNPPIMLGDLKASSVYVSPTGQALLSDIGIAAIPQPPDWGYHGVDDARWLAPEVMDPSLRPHNSKDKYEHEHDESHGTPDATLPMTPESDVYSFGMLAYEMHTRARPFAPTVWAAAVIVRVVAGKRPPRPTAQQSPFLTDPLWELIELCWKQDYRERPTMAAVLAWLEVLNRTARVGDGVSVDRGTLV